MRPSSELLVGMVKLLVGAYPRWSAGEPAPGQRLYFANHSSHIDTLAIWSALPRNLRRHTHPVAARDYWGRGFRRYVATQGLRAVLIDRTRERPEDDPLAPLIDVLDRGESLIMFPEGTRGRQAFPGPFKSGLYRLATRIPGLQLIPVYLENLHRSMPKGAVIPIPVTCIVRFGEPLPTVPEESKDAFLERARLAVIRLGGGAAAAAVQ